MADLNEEQALEMFDEYLDGCCGGVEIAGVSRPYSCVLKELDQVAYDCAFADWASEYKVKGYY